MQNVFYIIGCILAIVGLYDLCRRLASFLQESVFISLRTPEKVLQWQCVQIARASYVSAKKLYRLSKLLPRGPERDDAISTSKEYLDLRRRIYTNLKHSGFQVDEFVLLCKKADVVMSNITGKTQFNMPNKSAGGDA